MAEPRERPILFSGPMVRALLEGRKTQTRRLLKPQPVEIDAKDGGRCWHFETRNGFVNSNANGSWMPSMVRHHVDQDGGFYSAVCPYGAPPDRLWVRETWASLEYGARGPFVYRADLPDGERVRVDAPWRPSIHMPRRACRLLLEVTEVRVQRLQAITEEDARAEGMAALSKDGGRTVKYGLPDRDGLPGMDNDGLPWERWSTDARRPFKLLWERINGATSWDTNPWVWALSFRRVEDSR